jgi:very-short-patch-repair endonuclease
MVDLRLATAESRPGALPARELRRTARQANVLGLPMDESSRQDRTRGDLERAFMTLCRRRRLPVPEVNVRVGAYLAEDDRARELELRRLGYEVLHLSEKQINEEADRVAEVISQAVAEGLRR